VRYATDVVGRRPPASATTHLVEYIIRTAVRERWVIDDIASCAARLRRLMFSEHASELVEMAEMSGFVFVEDATSGVEEVLSSSSDLALIALNAPGAGSGTSPPQTDTADTNAAADDGQ